MAVECIRQYQVAVGCIKAVSGGYRMYYASIRWLWDVLRQYQVDVGCIWQYQVAVRCIKSVSGGCGMY